MNFSIFANMMIQTDETLIEAGCDEAGRGCLAGPVVAAAVILPLDFKHHLLNDSKLVSEKNRNILKEVIKAEAIDYGIGVCDIKIIEDINILQATIIAMHRALSQLQETPQKVAVDGNYFKPWENTAFECCIKGDSRYMNIAAASILAKTYRDEYMMTLHQDYPVYHWNKNKGYPTKQHREAISLHGISPFHRKTFKLL